jgi:hypothetical protein
MAKATTAYDAEAQMYGTDDNTIASAHVTVRLAEASDERALMRLAALDSAEVPSGPSLLAEVDGRAVAALPVLGGSAIADPFSRTGAMVAMLELRALQLRGEGRLAAPRRSRTERLRGLVRAPRALSLR